ncbi:MAG: IS481 family transposase [Vicinamibacteria bacterium]
MPWKVCDAMSLRREFVEFVQSSEINFTELCRRFGISRTKGYKWVGRYREFGLEGLKDRSRRPVRSPKRSRPVLEEAVVALRRQHGWGGRKIRRRLLDMGWAEEEVCASSTVTEILRRHELVAPPLSSAAAGGWKRFEADAPNELWQMDFKGHFAMEQARCHPLTVLDDCSRFSLSLTACLNERSQTVQAQLTAVFRCYGLPWQMLMDNGSPWGSDERHRYTPLTAWMIRLDIKPIHSRPYHPQTLGKDERFHRTLKAELLSRHRFRNLEDCQRQFDSWREVYNFERPHESLDMRTPSKVYQPSLREFPESLPPIEYGPEDIVRKVHENGYVFFGGQRFRVGKAFVGERVALRHTTTDGVLDVYFCHHQIRQLNLTTGDSVID